MSAESARREFAKSAVDAAVRRALNTRDRRLGRAFADLLSSVRGRSGLLRPAAYVGRDEPGLPDRIVAGLLALAAHRDGWIRPPDAWEPGGRSAVGVFSSLAHHLLARYPAPPVLLSAWFRGLGGTARRRQRWFRHAALGGSLRTAGFPLALTRRAAHFLAHAPNDLTIEAALRWAQVRALEGRDALARAVAATRLGRSFEAPEFWDPVVLLIVRGPRLELDEVEVMVDHLNDARSTLARDRGRAVAADVLRGRSAGTIAKAARSWREARLAAAGRRTVAWLPSGIAPFRRPAGDGLAWTIRELLDADALVAEGEAMRHCVGGYRRECVAGISTIWSVGIEGSDGRRRRATVEVAPGSREVVQVKAFANADPDPETTSVIEEWARREGLEVSL